MHMIPLLDTPSWTPSNNKTLFKQCRPHNKHNLTTDRQTWLYLVYLLFRQYFSNQSFRNVFPIFLVQPSRVKISNVHYINVKGTSSSNVAVDLMCSPQFPCEHIHLYNVNLKHTGKGPATSTCSHAKVAFGGVVHPPVTCHQRSIEIFGRTLSSHILLPYV